MSRIKAIYQTIHEYLDETGESSFYPGDIAERMTNGEDSEVSRYIGTEVWRIMKKGHLARPKENPRKYALTQNGRKYLEKEILNGVDWVASFRLGPKLAAAQSQPQKKSKKTRYTKTAVSAIESIGAIIDQNERLVNVLKMINKQTSMILEEIESERNQSDL